MGTNSRERSQPTNYQPKGVGVDPRAGIQTLVPANLFSYKSCLSIHIPAHNHHLLRALRSFCKIAGAGV